MFLWISPHQQWQWLPRSMCSPGTELIVNEQDDHPWMWKRAFMQLKAERGQNKLAGSLIWNGPDPLRLVVRGGAAAGGWHHSASHVTRGPSHGDFSLQHTQKLSFMKLNIIIILIRSHLFTLFKKKQKQNIIPLLFLEFWLEMFLQTGLLLWVAGTQQESY